MQYTRLPAGPEDADLKFDRWQNDKAANAGVPRSEALAFKYAWSSAQKNGRVTPKRAAE